VWVHLPALFFRPETSFCMPVERDAERSTYSSLHLHASLTVAAALHWVQPARPTVQAARLMLGSLRHFPTVKLNSGLHLVHACDMKQPTNCQAWSSAWRGMELWWCGHHQ
jgi:hypothetical protein